MQMLEMIIAQLKLLFRNRVAIVATIALPLILTYLFSFSQGTSGKEVLYTADLDNSLYSKQFIAMINQHSNVEVMKLSEADIKKKVDNQDISIGLIINKGFGDSLTYGKKPDLKIVQNHVDGDGAILQDIVSSEAANLTKIVKDSNYTAAQLRNMGAQNSDDISKSIFNNIIAKLKGKSNLSINDKSLTDGAKKQDNATVRLIGFLAMFLWFVVIQGCRTLIDEKENKTFNRLLGTPINYNKYLLAKVIATYIYGGVHVIAILLAGKYILKVSFINNIPAVGAIFAAYLLALISITLIFVTFIKKQQQFTAFASVLIVVTGMLGGSFFSLEIAPKIMEIISKFTPEGWIIPALTDVIFNGSTIIGQLIPISIFVGIGVIGLLISAVLENIKIKIQFN